MVQLIKFRSLSINPAMEAIIDEFHDKLSRRDLASKIGVHENILKYYLKSNGYPLKREGRHKVPFDEQKVTISVSGIPRKYYTEACLAAEQAVSVFKVNPHHKY